MYQRTHGTTHLHHPLVGDLVQGYEAFAPVDDPEQTLGPATVEPGSPHRRTPCPAGRLGPVDGAEPVRRGTGHGARTDHGPHARRARADDVRPRRRRAGQTR